LDKLSIRSVPVVAITALSDEMAKLQEITPHFDGFLRKPFMPDSLMRVIRAVLHV
jgi:DNA-binding response OmpR family regulator